MSELRELYQEMILDHGKRPRNFHEVDGASCRAHGHNPLCGDKITVFVRTDGDRVVSAGFTGSGCAISTASASMMTEAIKGRSIEECDALFDSFHELVAQEEGDAASSPLLGKLIVFDGVRQFPMRVKCATLAWHTLRAALRQAGESVTTE